jgi:hypothetical protein
VAGLGLRIRGARHHVTLERSRDGRADDRAAGGDESELITVSLPGERRVQRRRLPQRRGADVRAVLVAEHAAHVATVA